MNKVFLIGRLTRDPEIRGEGDKKSARFTLAVDKFSGAEKSADFIGCVAFRKSADLIERYVTKGTKLAIEGRISTGSYTNKDGKTVWTTDVVVDRTEFVEARRTAQEMAEKTSDEDLEFMSIPDTDDEALPFH